MIDSAYLKAFLTIGYVLLAVQAGCAAPPQPVARVLMIAGGHAHDYQSLPPRLAQRLVERGNITVDVAEYFRPEGLDRYDVLLFNNCQACEEGKLDQAGEQAIIVDFVRGGKGLVAMHCALWSFQEWPEWRKLVGGIVLRHAAFGPYSVSVLDPADPTMLGLGNQFEVTDEAYFVDELDPQANVLVRTTAVQVGRDGKKRPAPDAQVWTKHYGQGRVFAMTFGHDEKSQFDERVLSVLHNGIRWAGRLTPEPQHNRLTKPEQQTGWQLLFNGRDLSGWTGDTAHWSVENGELVGRTLAAASTSGSLPAPSASAESKPARSASGGTASEASPRRKAGAAREGAKSDLPHNMFLTHEGEFSDFVLKCWVKLRNHNSGVQIRSRQFPENVVKGYQADIADQWYGSLYEEGGTRGVLANGWKDKGETVTVLDGWNEMTIRAVGPRITITLNGVTTVDYTEKQPELQPAKGVIALQLHAGPPMEVRFRDIRVQPIVER